MRELIITNGDSAGDSLKKAYPEMVVLPWRDVLHEGPVPMTPEPTELSNVRVRYLNDKWGAEAGADFGARDGLLADVSDFERISLWFEHDLYDQLQLLQVLDRLHFDMPTEDLSLVQADDYLGQYGPDEISVWQSRSASVTQTQLDTATLAWHAFRQETPQDWCALLQTDLSSLPHLQAAVVRMLEELPSIHGGVSRTERHILEMVDQGHHHPAKIFKAYQVCEEAHFMGDWSFFDRLNGLSTAIQPLLISDRGTSFPPQGEEAFQDYLAGHYRLSDFGQAVLAGDQDHAHVNAIDFWWGGTYVTNEHLWRWNAKTQGVSLG